MAKILIINVPAHGHVNPTIGLTKALVRAGHDVTYLVSEEFRSKIEPTGAVFESYDFDNKRPFTEKNVRRVYDRALELGKNADCIVYEMMFFLGKALGDKLNKPTVRLYSCFAWNKEISQQVFNNCGFKLKLLGNRAFRKVAFSRRLKSFETKTQDIIDEITDIPADLNIVYTTREFQVDNDRFDDKIWKFVGPSIVDRNDKNDIPFNEIKNKIIYVSLGTIFNNSLKFFKNCIEAFKNTDVTVIMSIGKTLKKEQLGKIPNNFYVYNFVPQIEVLKRTDLFITHGGMNSTSEAMYFGVPLIVVPQAADQPIVGKRIEDLELGRVINKNNISSNIIRNYANEILNDDRYKDNMMKMRTKVRQAGGEERVVELINDLLKEKLGSD